jgi:polyketide biosynthesis enoyl-CoA hydratase PksH
MVLNAQQTGRMLVLTICRPKERNAINGELLAELSAAFSRAESDESVRVVVIQGQSGVFCTGTDFGDIPQSPEGGRALVEASSRLYFRTLRGLTASSKIVVSLVEGEAQAGGLGLIAASDHAICSAASTFRLPEILLGMMPACVIPFLIRRVGFQKCYSLALTARKLDARQAVELGLVDQVAADPRDALRRFVMSVDRIPADAVARLKGYMSGLAGLPEDCEDRAVDAIAGMLTEPRTRERVEELMRHGLWQEAGR